jgi:hypothetical protein
MKLEERIMLFSELGKEIRALSQSDELLEVVSMAKSKNAWFTSDNIIKSIENIINAYLDKEKLNAFANNYILKDLSNKKQIGIVAAGNIPLVAFQDIIHTILSGNIALIKPSTQDESLILYFFKKMQEINKEITNYYRFETKLNDADAFIATGSGNSSRYFEYYFAKKPHIIRKNRTSVAVLDGTETKIELADLANDIFTFFGLGCRNVSKIYVPEGYDFSLFFESIEYWNTINMHSKYNNNYDYMKAIYLVNRVEHLDNGFLLLKEDSSFASPISVLFYEKYAEIKTVNQALKNNQESIQVIISKNKKIENALSYGKSQTPQLADYADNVDTMKFLVELN